LKVNEYYEALMYNTMSKRKFDLHALQSADLLLDIEVDTLDEWVANVADETDVSCGA
jgi:hypothetical protein